jgi:hypothetical protein
MEKKIENVRLNGMEEIELVRANGTTEGKGWYLWNHHRQARYGTYRTRKEALSAMSDI